MNNIQNLLHSPEIQAKLHLKSAHIKLSPDKKRALGNAYLKLYFGLSCANWTNKKNLGTAWQTSLSQVQNIINARDEKNPATQFLRVMHETHKSTWPRHIMTHPQRDAMFTGNESEMREYALRNIRSAMGEITLLSSQCKFEMEKAQPKTAAKQPLSAAPDKSEQKKPDMSIEAKEKAPLPQTQNGAPIAAKPGLNSNTAPEQNTGTNSKQTAIRPAEIERSISQEERDKKLAEQIKKSVDKSAQPDKNKKTDMKPEFNRATGHIINMAEIMRMQMMMRANQKVA